MRPLLEARLENGSRFRAVSEQLRITDNRNQPSVKTSSRLNLPPWLIVAVIATIFASSYAANAAGLSDDVNSLQRAAGTVPEEKALDAHLAAG